MIAESLLALALSVVAAPPEGSGPPIVTFEELHAAVEAGNYHRVRIEMLGRRLQGTATVKMISVNDRWPLLELEGHFLAALHGLPEDHALAVGDRVRFDGLIVDEAYSCLHVWTYDYEKLPPEASATEPAAERTAQPASAAPNDLSAIRFCEAAPSAAAPSLYEQVQRNASKARTNEQLLPKLTTADLDACQIGSDYLRVRKEYIGLRLDADVVVEKVIENAGKNGGAWALVRLSDNWQAHLVGHRISDYLKEGDRLRIVGIVCDEAYSAVTVWVERGEHLPEK